MPRSSIHDPETRARPWLTSLEPWQINHVNGLRELGLDGDAIVRAGVTLALATIAGSRAVGLGSLQERR